MFSFRIRLCFFSLKLFLPVLLSTSLCWGQDSLEFRLTTGDLNIGGDFRLLNSFDSTAYRNTVSTVQGLSLRYQSSIVFHTLNKRTGKKLRAGDLLSGEIAAGALQSNHSGQEMPFWFAYRFEMGASFIYQFRSNTETNVNLILLRFARDYITQNISGSGIEFRFRYKRLVAEAGLGSRQLRIIGFPIPYLNKDEEQNILQLGARFLFTRKTNAGLRLELLNRNISQNRDGLFNLRFFYGKYF